MPAMLGGVSLIAEHCLVCLSPFVAGCGIYDWFCQKARSLNDVIDATPCRLSCLGQQWANILQRSFKCSC
jgi:hypothetical protein